MTGNSRMDAQIQAVERAMVTVRRRQNRRTLAGLVPAGEHPGVAVTEVLDVVEEDESGEGGRGTTVTGLAHRLGVDQPRASKLVNLAVDAGLLRRESDPADGRRSVLRLTAPGRAHLDSVHAHRRSVFAGAMREWTPDERSAFAGLLTRFVTALPEAARQEEGR